MSNYEEVLYSNHRSNENTEPTCENRLDLEPGYPGKFSHTLIYVYMLRQNMTIGIILLSVSKIHSLDLAKN